MEQFTNSTETVVKLLFADDLRRFTIPKGISFGALCDQVITVLGLDKTTDLALKYRDNEGDLITITSDVELNSALVPGQILRITASIKSTPAGNTVPPGFAPIQANSIGPGLAPGGMLGAFGMGPNGPASFARGCGGWRNRFTPEEWAQLKEERATWCKMKKDKKDTMSAEEWAQFKELKEQRKKQWKEHKKGRGFGAHSHPHPHPHPHPHGGFAPPHHGHGGFGPRPAFHHHHHGPHPGFGPQHPFVPLAPGQENPFGRFRGCDDGEKLIARFAKDVSFEDGAEVSAGVPFVKTWRIRNEGPEWPAGCVLRLLSKRSDTMGSPELIPIEAPVSAGQEVEISVPLVAPIKPGRYTAYFKLSAPNGKKFGQRLWVSVVVPSVSSSSSEGEKEADKLEQLVDSVLAMGFCVKRHRVFRMLQKCDGDVEKVSQILYAKTQKKAMKEQLRGQKKALKEQMKAGKH